MKMFVINLVRCRRLILQRSNLYLLSFFCMGIVFFLVHEAYVQSVEHQFYNSYIGTYIKNNIPRSNVCRIPFHDPFDPIVLQFIKKIPSLHCRTIQPYLTYIDTNGYLKINLSGINDGGYTKENVQCFYEEVVAKNMSDNEIETKIPQAFWDNEKLLSDTNLVKCYSKEDKTQIYENVHSHIKPPLLKYRQSAFENKKPSVFIFVLDSMSRLNFIRQLPKTYEFLLKNMNATVLKGLTKVADNTFPNIIPMMTGVGLKKKEDFGVPTWEGPWKSKFCDDLPLVWKNFSKAGYTTAFLEDCPEFSIFNYVSKGFQLPPTDVYTRPYWLAMQKSKVCKKSDFFCFGNELEHMLLYRHTKDYLKKYANTPYFLFSFLTRISHDNINTVQAIDSDVLNVIEEAYENGEFWNTIVIVMGDHGNRFDDIRSTVIGRIEERMPFFAISLPLWVKRKFPKLKKNLERNSEILLSWYDLYELLMDIAMENLEEESHVQRWGNLGLSPFRAIPSNRSCRDIGIPKEYCVCVEGRDLPADDVNIQTTARIIVEEVNKMLHPVSNACSSVTLRRVINAQILLPGIGVASSEDFVVTFQVMIEILPSFAKLEGTVELDAWNSYKLVGDINRINRYGNQSWCVDDNLLKLYCFCNSTYVTNPFTNVTDF